MFFFFPQEHPPEGLSIYLIGNAALNFYNETDDHDTVGFLFRRNPLSKKYKTTFILTEEYPFFGNKYNFENVNEALKKSLTANNWEILFKNKRLHLLIFDPSELFSVTAAVFLNKKIHSEEEVVLPVILSPILDNEGLTNNSVFRYLEYVSGDGTYVLCSDHSKLKEIKEICEEAIKTQPFFQSAIESNLETVDGVELVKKQ